MRWTLDCPSGRPVGKVLDVQAGYAFRAASMKVGLTRSAGVSGLMPVISRNQTFSPRAKAAASIEAFVVGDLLQRGDLEDVGGARGAADIRLDRVVDFVGRMRLDPLRRPPDRGDEGLHLGRVLVDGRLQREMRRHRHLAADILVPDRLVGAVEQQRAPALLLGIVEQRQRTDEHVDLLGLQRTQHGVDIAGADPGHFLVEPHRLHVIGRPDMVGAAQRRHRDDRLAPVGPLPFRQLLQRGDALVAQILADDEHHRSWNGYRPASARGRCGRDW